MNRWSAHPAYHTGPSIVDGCTELHSLQPRYCGVSDGTTTDEDRLSLLRGVEARRDGVLGKRDVEGLLTATQCHDGLILNATTTLVTVQEEKG